MNLLAAKFYDPAAAVTKATTALLAMTAIDTTNLRLSFTVPAHGMVRVRLAGILHGATTIPSILLGVLNGATVVGRAAPIQSLGNTAVATALVSVEADFILTGLTPGAVAWDAAYGVETIVAATGLKYGGPNDATTNNAFGGFAFEVWDPQSQTTTGQLSVNASGQVAVASIAANAITAASIATDAITAAKIATDADAAIADAVWDEVLSGHLTAGTTGAALSGAGSAGDPWGTVLPGAYGVGTAGKIVGDNLNATVASRSTYAGGAVASVTGAVGSVTAAVTLPTIPANWITAAGIAAAALNGKGDWNVGKTGYALTQAFPANFSTLAINASGHVSRVTLVDTTTTNTDMRGTNSAALAATALSNVTWTDAKAAFLDASVLSRSTLAAGAAMTLTVAYDAAKTAATQASVNAIPTNPITSLSGIATASDVTGAAATIAAYGDTRWSTAAGFAIPGDSMTLTTLPIAPPDWISADAVSAGAVSKIQAGMTSGGGSGPTAIEIRQELDANSVMLAEHADILISNALLLENIRAHTSAIPTSGGVTREPANPANGVAWGITTATSRVVATLYKAGYSGAYQIGGNPIPHRHATVALASGEFALELPPNTLITPAGSVWRVTIAATALQIDTTIFAGASNKVSAA